jgi:hypothetical protein
VKDLYPLDMMRFFALLRMTKACSFDFYETIKYGKINSEIRTPKLSKENNHEKDDPIYIYWVDILVVSGLRPGGLPMGG